MTKVSMTIDGVRYDDDVEPRMLLVHYLREVAGRIGTPIGCDTSNCGACTVLLNGLSAKSCSVLAVQADPRSPEHGQYGFLQDLVRHVVYETLSRHERRTRHLALGALQCFA